MNAGRRTIWIYALSALTLIPAGQIKSGETDPSTPQALEPAPPLVGADGSARAQATSDEREVEAQIPADPMIVHEAGLSYAGQAHLNPDAYHDAATLQAAQRSHPMRQELPIAVHSLPAEALAAVLAGRILAMTGFLPLAAFFEAEAAGLPAVRLGTDQASVVRPLAED